MNECVQNLLVERFFLHNSFYGDILTAAARAYN